jgi:hypothetical protein
METTYITTQNGSWFYINGTPKDSSLTWRLVSFSGWDRIPSTYKSGSVIKGMHADDASWGFPERKIKVYR